MKRNIYEVFDGMNSSAELSTQQPFCSDPEFQIDTKKIKTGVLSRINKNGRYSSFGKKLTIILVAATLGAAALGTTVIAALGGPDRAFSGIFAGDINSAGFYSGSNVYVNAYNDNLDAQLLGISGDENTLYAAVRLSHKDKSSFVKNTDSHVGIPSDTAFEATEEDDLIDFLHMDDNNAMWNTVDKSFFQQFRQTSDTMSGAYSAMGGWELLPVQMNDFRYGEKHFAKISVDEDGKALTVYIRVINTTDTLIGNTMRLHIDSLSEYVPGKLLETHEAVGDTETDAENFSRELSDKYYSKNIEVRIDEKKDGRLDIWEVKNERIPVGLDLSVKLDYKADNPCVDIDGDSTAQLFEENVPDSAVIRISPLGIRLYADVSKTSGLKTENITVITKDGKNYGVYPTINLRTDGSYTEMCDYISQTGKTADEVTDILTKDDSFGNKKVTVINPGDIEKIIIGEKSYTIK